MSIHNNQKQSNPLIFYVFSTFSILAFIPILGIFAAQKISTFYLQVPHLLSTYKNIHMAYGFSAYTENSIHITPWLSIIVDNSSTIAALSVLIKCFFVAIFLISTWILAYTTSRSTIVALTSGLLIISSTIPFALPHITIENLAFATSTNLALAFLYCGWIKPFAPIWLIVGFLFTGLSGLLGGLPGILIPIISSIFFLVWSGGICRSSNYDALLAFSIMLIMIFSWLAFTSSTIETKQLLKIFIAKKIIQPQQAIFTFKNKTFFKPLLLIFLTWLPWILTIFFIPWKNIIKIPYQLIINRSTPSPQGWIWISTITTLLYISLSNTNNPLSILCVYSMLALLSAQALLSLSSKNSTIFYLIIGVVFLIESISLGIFSVFPSIHNTLFPNEFPIFFRYIQSNCTENTCLILSAIGFLYSILFLKFSKKLSPMGKLFSIILYTTLLASIVDFSSNILPTNTTNHSSNTNIPKTLKILPMPQQKERQIQVILPKIPNT